MPDTRDGQLTPRMMRDRRANLTNAEVAGGLVFPDRLLRDYEAAAMLGRSRATFRVGVRKGDLPQPIRDGHMTFWRQSEIMQVIERLAAQRDEAPQQ